MDVVLKIVVLLLLGGLVALAAWFVEVPSLAEANAVPEKYEFCRTEIPLGQDMKFGRDELTHYYYSQAMHNLLFHGTSWEEYSKAVFDHLQNSQKKDDSWPAAEGIGVGPLYATALWSTVLQVGPQHPAVLISEGND